MAQKKKNTTLILIIVGIVAVFFLGGGSLSGIFTKAEPSIDVQSTVLLPAGGTAFNRNNVAVAITITNTGTAASQNLDNVNVLSAGPANTGWVDNTPGTGGEGLGECLTTNTAPVNTIPTLNLNFGQQVVWQCTMDLTYYEGLGGTLTYIDGPGGNAADDATTTVPLDITVSAVVESTSDPVNVPAVQKTLTIWKDPSGQFTVVITAT